jgi:hypothetical protein
MRIVGFALTGSDDADPNVIGDRAKCVFAINHDIFRLEQCSHRPHHIQSQSPMNAPTMPIAISPTEMDTDLRRADDAN